MLQITYLCLRRETSVSNHNVRVTLRIRQSHITFNGRFYKTKCWWTAISNGHRRAIAKSFISNHDTAVGFETPAFHGLYNKIKKRGLENAFDRKNLCYYCRFLRMIYANDMLKFSPTKAKVLNSSICILKWPFTPCSWQHW